MNEYDNEQISGLTDGFWADDEGRSDSKSALAGLNAGLAALGNDAAAQAKWTRYHLIRAALQEDQRSHLGAGFASRVSAAIKAEPSIVAFPTSARAQAPSSSAKVVSGNFRRNVVGLSVAATVAMVSLVGLNVLQSSRDEQPQNTLAQVLPGAETMLPVTPAANGQIQLVSNPIGSYWVGSEEQAVSPEFEQRLNMFLSQHIEYSPTADVKGMLSYSRLAGYDTTRRPQ